MKILSLWLTTCLLLLFNSCQTEEPSPEGTRTTEEVIKQLSEQEDVTGNLNPFKLIENPEYIAVQEVDRMDEDDMVFITKAGGEVLVYPHRQMYVEVVNEETNGVVMAITYCPITRSGINWNRVLGADTLLLTASGYLYKENLMPLDVNSGNIWSQMLMRRFQGDARQGDIFAFRDLSNFPLIETKWRTVRDHFPEARVYFNDNSKKALAFAPLEQQMGIVDRETVEIFTLEMFPGEIVLHLSARVPGGMIVVAGSSTHHYMLAFRTNYQMEPVEGAFPVIMQDNTGTLWNIFGEGVEGEHAGETLDSPLYFTAVDWAWRALYEEVHLFQPKDLAE